MSTLKEEIILILEELGGEVVDRDGQAVRQIFKRVASTGTYSSVSTAVGELEQAGLVVRDQPNLKRTTRVALNGPGVRPGRKSLEVVMEKVSRTLADAVRADLQLVIDAHVAAGMQEQGTDPAKLEETEHKLAMAQAEVGDLRLKLRDAEAEPTRLRGQLDQVRQELEETREQLRIAQHNTEVWRRNAMGKPKVREMLTTFRDHLDDDSRRELDRLMRELPGGK